MFLLSILAVQTRYYLLGKKQVDGNKQTGNSATHLFSIIMKLLFYHDHFPLVIKFERSSLKLVTEKFKDLDNTGVEQFSKYSRTTFLISYLLKELSNCPAYDESEVVHDRQVDDDQPLIITGGHIPRDGSHRDYFGKSIETLSAVG